MGHLKIILVFLAKKGLFPIQGFWYNGQKHIDDIDLIADLGQICGITHLTGKKDTLSHTYF